MLFFAAAFEVAADNKPSVKIVHIGDSLSAGNGASEYYAEGWYGPKYCFRNKYNWGQQAANIAFDDVFSVTYTNAACSGGKVADIEESRILPDNSCSPSTSSDHTVGPRRWFGGCENKVRPQIDAIGQHTDYVFLTMGVNELGYLNVLMRCIFTGPDGGYVTIEPYGTFGGSTKDCVDATKHGFEYVAKFMANDYKKILTLITDKMNPDAKLIVASYPHLVLLDEGNSRNTGIRNLIDVATQKQREVIDDFNAALVKEGKKEMVSLYTGASDSFAGKEAVIGRNPITAMPPPNKDGYFVEYRNPFHLIGGRMAFMRVRLCII